jgi:hypothetical protein
MPLFGISVDLLSVPVLVDNFDARIADSVRMPA